MGVGKRFDSTRLELLTGKVEILVEEPKTSIVQEPSDRVMSSANELNV